MVHLRHQVDKIDKSPCSVREHKVHIKIFPKISNKWRRVHQMPSFDVIESSTSNTKNNECGLYLQLLTIQRAIDCKCYRLVGRYKISKFKIWPLTCFQSSDHSGQIHSWNSWPEEREPTVADRIEAYRASLKQVSCNKSNSRISNLFVGFNVTFFNSFCDI